MKKEAGLLALVAGLVVAVGLLATGGPAPTSDYHAITEKFFQHVAGGKPEEGVEYLFGLNPWMSRKADELDKTKGQVASFSSMLGEYRGHEVVVEKALGDRFVHLSYLAYYARQPVRFNFQFYKAKGTWMTYFFNFDDTFTAEVAAAASFDAVLRKQEQ